MDPTDNVLREEITYKGVRFEIEIAANAIMNVGPFTLNTPLPIKRDDVHPANANATYKVFLRVLDNVIDAARRQGIDLI